MACKKRTLDEWKELGVMSKRIYHAILEERHHHFKSSKKGRWLSSAMKANMQMRHKLDNLVFELFPDQETQTLARIFYGSLKEKN